MKDLSITDAYDIISEKLISWATNFIDMLPNILVAVVILILFYLLSKLARRITGKVFGTVSNNVSLVKLLGNTISLIIVVIGFFFALGVLNLDKTVTSLLAGVGVIGLALGFAFQDTAANFMSGIFLAVQKTFKVGDIIKSNDYMGIVEHINLRATIIHTFQGQEIILPNKMVFQSAIENYSETNRRRVDLSCGISYGDDLDKVKEVAIKSLVGAEFLASEDSVDFIYTEFGDSSINFDLRFWLKDTTQGTYNTAKSEAIVRLKKALDANDIMIPFPIRTLDFGIKGGEKLNTMLKSRMD